MRAAGFLDADPAAFFVAEVFALDEDASLDAALEATGRTDFLDAGVVAFFVAEAFALDEGTPLDAALGVALEALLGAAAFLAAGFFAEVAAAFLAAGFFAEVAAAFLAAGFFAEVAAAFLAVGFLAIGFFAVEVDALAVVVFLDAAVLLAEEVFFWAADLATLLEVRTAPVVFDAVRLVFVLVLLVEVVGLVVVFLVVLAVLALLSVAFLVREVAAT